MGSCGQLWEVAFERSEGQGHRHWVLFFRKNWGDSRKVASLGTIAQWGGHWVGWRRGLGKGWGQGCLELVWLLTNLKTGKQERWELSQTRPVMKEETQGCSTHPSFRKQLPCRKSELRDVCPQACLWEEVQVFLNVLGDYFCSFEDGFALPP